MTEVNLLPPELRRRHRARSITRRVVVGFAGVVLLLLVVFFFESARLTSVKNDLSAQLATNQALQTQINTLQRFADLQGQLSEKKELVTNLEQGEVLWSGVLHDLSMVMPSDVYLTNFTGAVSIGPEGWETEPDSSGLIGSMQFTGVSLDYPNMALWLDRMVNVKGWEDAWVSSATTNQPSQGSTSSVGVNFNGSVNLSADAAQNGRAP